MLTKLTLSIDKVVIERAKQYAQKTGRSLSDLVETYLESLVESDKDPDSKELPPKLRRLLGSVKISADLDHKKEIRRILTSGKRK